MFVRLSCVITNFTLATWGKDDLRATNVNTYSPSVESIIKYCNAITKQHGDDAKIIVGYEAGCLGFQLYRQLKDRGIECVVMAPSTIVGTEVNRRRKVKTDKRDAIAIAESLKNNQYKAVYVPDEEDEAVRDFIRMRTDHKQALKRIKQQICALCHRHGYHYTEGRNYWTQKHLNWLNSLPLTGVLKETLDEYLLSYEHAVEKLTQLDARIVEIAETDKYREKVHKLICFKGIKEITALALIVEIGDFSRFIKAKGFASFLGLVSGRLDSGDHNTALPITRQGNTFLRRLLVEASQSFSRARQSKSAALKKRQKGCEEAVIAYADKANERLRKRYYKLVLTNKKSHNKAVTAVARELACFIWGMMTGNIHTALA